LLQGTRLRRRGQIEANHAAFQEAIAGEIAWFEQRAASDLQARAELRAPILEAELLNTGHDVARIAIYYERTERIFAQKWKLLKEYRAAQANEEQQSGGGTPPTGSPAPHALPAG
jgi:hypothetical protein